VKHFTLDEFASPDLPDSGSRMDPHFLELLDSIREEAGIPFHINSGFRTLAHNMEVNGGPNSAHTRGLAADVVALTGKQKYIIAKAAIIHGITRIGIGKTFVHLDNDSTLPNPTIWLY
jgi:uncharacterized protein YcbK (DUF882 family)